MTALERARILRSRGLSIFRIPLRSKTPTTAWKAWQTRLASDSELVAMFVAESNIGIVTGAVSNLVVIDADSQDAQDYLLRHLPPTPWQTRTVRGMHFYFRHPGVPVANRHLPSPALDIKGDGGHVLAPGSVHPTGRRYRAAGHWECPQTALPVFAVEWFPSRTPAPPARPPASPQSPTLLRARARAYLEAMPLPEIGQGSDHATFVAACRLVRGFDLPPPDAESLLWEWCGNRDGWTRKWVADKVDSAKRNGREARGGLR
jgi:hypothetical protein